MISSARAIGIFMGWLAGSSLVAALPAFEAGRASVEQVYNPDHEFNPAFSVYKTHLKYGWPIDDDLKQAVSKSLEDLSRRGNGSTVVTLPIDKIDKAYVSPVQIGTPPQTLLLDFDTGSSDMWVFSSETPKSMVQGQSFYTAASSQTSKQMAGASWVISYGDGSSCNGIVYTDKVTIGNLTVPNQAVEAARRVSAQFTGDAKIHGLLGLGFSHINTVSPTKQKTFFDNAKAGLEQPLFTCDLRRRANGTYDFGFIDKSKYTGDIFYTPVNQNRGYWSFTSSGYAVGNNTFSATSIAGIADTGSTLLYLPPAIVSAFYAKVPKAANSRSTYGGYTFPCSTVLPSFTFGIGTGRITIPSNILVHSPVSTRGTASTTCFGGIQSNEDTGLTIFGDIALKAAFVVFDGGSGSAASPRIGWAAKPLSDSTSP